MNKKELVDAILAQLQKDVVVLADAAKATYEAATHEESKPENEYDTRGLEASYLAGAQAKRVYETQDFMEYLRNIRFNIFDKTHPIGETAVVQLKLESKISWIFILPLGGGFQIDFDGKSIQVVTPKSPLGEALMGQNVGDDAVVETGAHVKEYEILKVI